MKRRPVAILFALSLGLLAATTGNRIELKPDERAGWSPSQIFAFVRGDHYYKQRTLEIETVPPGAQLDLFYVRASFQKRYEQTEAPVVVDLPKRIEAGPRDSVTIRAYLEGYKLETVHVPVRGGQEKVEIQLAALPNTLMAVSHTYFSGRAGLTLLLKEPPNVRVQKSKDGFSLVVTQTGRSPEVTRVLDGLQSPMIAEIETQQLGEDLMVQVRLAEGLSTDDVELRSRQGQDMARDLYRFTVDLIPTDRGVAATEAARQALARIRGQDVTGCALSFDEGLRDEIDAEQLARALTPRGEFTDPYLRSALRRLGEVSPGGVIRLSDGSKFRPGVPLELAAAASQAQSAEGYLALLRQWVRLMEPEEYRAEALRSLVAPEMEPQRFVSAVASAAGAEHACRGATASATP